MGIVVQKFGGTSVANPEAMRRVAKRAIECKEAGNQVVVVVSAMGHSTDELLDLMHQVTNKPEKREVDMLLATGEQVSISLVAMTIAEMGHQSISLTGPQVAILTDSVHGSGKILRVEKARLLQELAHGKIVVVAGFQGKTDKGEITTLGRGGSDTTAVAVAAAISADVCEIFTDVDGVYTTDPRLVPEAKKLKSIGYDEMLEMASLGALVLQPRSVEYAKNTGVKIHVRSSFNYNEGTIVRESADMEKELAVKGLALDKNCAKMTIFNVPDKPGVAMKLFSALADEHINVDMIVQSNSRAEFNDISFTIEEDQVKKAFSICQQIKEELGATGASYDDQVAKISIIGAGMKTNAGTAAKMFEALAEAAINIHLISTSEIKISCIIDQVDAKKAVAAIHSKFELEK
ncbi:MAG: aspartate kinase [Clostridia bacterium]